MRFQFMVLNLLSEDKQKYLFNNFYTIWFIKKHYSSIVQDYFLLLWPDCQVKLSSELLALIFHSPDRISWVPAQD